MRQLFLYALLLASILFAFCSAAHGLCDDILQNALSLALSSDADAVELQYQLCELSSEEVKLHSTEKLCLIMLQKRKYESSMHYALQSLEQVPTYAPSLQCLAEAYFHMNDMLRASFFAEFSALADPSLRYLRSDQSFFEYLVSLNVASISLPSDIPVTSVLRDVIRDFVSSSSEAVTAYRLYVKYSTTSNGFANEASLGVYHTYSAIYRMHLFLNDLQALLSEPASPPPQQLCPRVSSLPQIKWPKHISVNIFSSPQLLRTFMETNVGLSDAFAMLGVPNRVSGGDPVDPTVVHIMSGAPAAVVREGIVFVRWGFEKASTVQHPDSEIVGFTTTEEGLSETRFRHTFIIRAASFWESILSNMVYWSAPSSNAHMLKSGPYLVPSFVPYNVIQHSCIMQQASMRYAQSTIDKISQKHQPIDILFFGNSNPHRESVRDEFMRAAKEMNWRVEFYMDYSLFGSKRDILIDLSKVYLLSI